MTVDDNIAKAALSLVKTPWHHQGRVAGFGCDCVGVGVLAGRLAGLEVVDYLTYPESPDSATLLAYMEANCDLTLYGEKGRTETAALDAVPPGYGMLFWMASPGHPQHFGIKTERGMVHALRRRNGKGEVVEQRLSSFYRERLHSVWRYRWQR